MKKKTRNIILIAGGGLILIAALVLWLMFKVMSQPMYKPGDLQGEKVNVPEQAAGAGLWQMEKDIRLYHFAEGAGRNILLVHGGPGIPWADTVPGFSQLAAKYRVHYYDQRGCGRSTRPFDRFTSTNYYQNMVALETKLGIRAQLKDIERIRQILGDDKIILIGHSYGAVLAALYAAEYPGHVEALVFSSPADLLKFPPADGGLFEQIGRLVPAEMQQEYAGWKKEYLNFGAIFTKSEADLQEMGNRFTKYYEAARRAKGLEMPEMPSAPELSGGWMVYAQYFSMGRKHDYRKAMKAVEAPVLVLHGANDLQPEAASKAFAECFPNVEFEVVQGSGHFPFVEQPDIFGKAVLDFLEKNTK